MALDDYLASAVGGVGVRRAHELGPTATIDVVGEEKAMLEVIESNEPLPRWLVP